MPAALSSLVRMPAVQEHACYPNQPGKRDPQRYLWARKPRQTPNEGWDPEDASLHAGQRKEIRNHQQNDPFVAKGLPDGVIANLLLGLNLGADLARNPVTLIFGKPTSLLRPVREIKDRHDP